MIYTITMTRPNTSTPWFGQTADTLASHEAIVKLNEQMFSSRYTTEETELVRTYTFSPIDEWELELLYAIHVSATQIGYDCQHLVNYCQTNNIVFTQNPLPPNSI